MQGYAAGRPVQVLRALDLTGRGVSHINWLDRHVGLTGLSTRHNVAARRRQWLVAPPPPQCLRLRSSWSTPVYRTSKS